MTYRKAKKLHNEDEVVLKENGSVLEVVSTEISEKTILVLCNDGNTYHHRDIA